MTDASVRANPVPGVATRRSAIEWNDTDASFPATATVHELVDKQVEQSPDAIALAFGATQMTYREMSAKADLLAIELRKLSVGPEVVVPICVERSADAVVGLLGVLKAGGAFLPLDPAYPAQRLQFMLADAKAQVVLTQRRLLVQLPLQGLRPVLLDELPHLAPAAVSSVPGPEARPQNLAYVIYTSGSTGLPKAVCLPHLALTNLFHWYGRTVAPGSHVLQFAPFTFDVSVHELFAAIASGGVLHIFPTENGVDIDELGQNIDDRAITRAVLPPIILRRLAEEFADLDRLGSLREIISTGDRLTLTPAILRFFERRPACALRNHYGATESQGGTLYSFPKAPQRWPDSAPLGRPADNVQLYILDEELQPVAADEVGEVYFGGAGHARGYLRLPGLTAERFTPSAVDDEPGARLYRTGDLARYHPDGTIQFLGRVDHQVKIRGFRVEPGEIETTLSQSTTVREAVVVPREWTDGERELVAYVVPSSSDPALTSTLRAFLKDRLPEHMIPSVFVPLQSLPLTANGKVDREALPEPDSARPQIDTDYIAPNTPLAQKLADIWAEVLRLDRVGVHDDFFEIGGDSIKAIQVVARLRDAGIEMPVRRIFEWPTIADLTSLD
jgi:amino acid adenylation domain-containing protein